MGVIGANMTLVVLRAPDLEHHYQTLGQGWEQTYKLGPGAVSISH